MIVKIYRMLTFSKYLSAAALILMLADALSLWLFSLSPSAVVTVMAVSLSMAFAAVILESLSKHMLRALEDPSKCYYYYDGSDDTYRSECGHTKYSPPEGFVCPSCHKEMGGHESWPAPFN